MAGCIGAVAVVVGSSAAFWAHDRAGHVTGHRVSVASATTVPPGSSTTSTTSTSTTSTTPTVPSTTTAPPNDLLAPPPTVVPSFDTSDGRAPVVHRVETTDPVIFITIDDGQTRDPTYLEHFLRLGVPFTSFLTQPLALAEPQYWTGTIATGGTVQTHSINHPNLRVSGEEKVRREVCEPADTFAFAFGARPTLFRPPYGNYDDRVRRVALECGYRAVVHWTGSTNNGVLTMQDGPLEAGDIILMHYRDTLHADLDDVVARARAEGFRIARLEDYLAPS